jgi:hypothetical protein
MSKVKKEAKRAGLFLRSLKDRYLALDGNIKNIYHACIQKTGSQWVKKVFGDPEIVRKTGLRVHPQFRYEVDEFKKRFPKYTFVPGLYIPYYLYNEIKKPKQYKTIYVVRDPRDVVVSWYYSMKYTHTKMGNVRRHREHLKDLNEKDGIEYCIKHLQVKFSFVREWWNNKEDPSIYMVRFEDLTKNPVSEWMDIFEHCDIEIDKRILKKVLSKYTKEKMRKRDLEQRPGGRSHYRKEKKGWRDLFDNHHIDTFYRVNGDIVNLLGYK